jgi:hypothetical protein
MNYSHKNILKYFNEFYLLYKNKPIANNKYGICFPHAFAIYYFLKKIKPKFIVESGIYKGQSTWLIEKTLPKTKLLSIDIKLETREYISSRINTKYSNLDFSNHDFSKIPRDSLVFFDDHQNFYQRLQQAYFFGFKHIIFEDNYPPDKGDFYTLNHALNGSGSTGKNLSYKKIFFTIYKIATYLIKKKKNPDYYAYKDLYNWGLNNVKKNNVDKINLRKVLKSYYTFPPVFKKNKTRWGDSWNFYATKKPLLDINLKEKYPNIYEEADSYNWITYIRLK